MKMIKVSMGTVYKFDIVAKDAVRNAFDNAGLALALREATVVITINGKNIEVSYHKAFKIIFDRVHEALVEKTNPKKTFEPPKEPVNKGKTPAFADAHPIWLPG